MSTPRNAAAASVSSSSSSFRRTSKAGSSPSFVAWCRKTFFGTTNTAFEEAEEEELVKTKATQQHDEDDEEEDLEESTECPICTTVSKHKLSYSVPCHHYACERCWASWVKQRDESKPLHCMICNQEIANVKFVKTHKPNNALTTADEMFEDTLRIVMTVNDKLGEIQEKLANTENHLGFLHEAAQMGELDQDALVSIVQVELVVVKEQLSGLVQIASTHIAQLPKSYAQLNTAMHMLFAQASDMLLNDSHVELEAFCDMLQCEQSRGKFTTLKHQWDSVFTLLASLLDSSVVNVIIFMVPSESKSLTKLMEQTKAKLSLSLPAITASGAEFEQLAQRLLHRVADEKVL